MRGAAPWALAFVAVGPVYGPSDERYETGTTLLIPSGGEGAGRFRPGTDGAGAVILCITGGPEAR